MEWNLFFDPLIQATLPALGTLLGSLIAYGTWQVVGLIKNEKLKQLASRAVAFAQQRIPNNDDKLTYAKQYLKTHASDQLSDDAIDHFVEEAVANLKKGLIKPSE